MASRRADEATRDVSDWLKCEFMQENVGKVYDGVISGVTSFGLFVELSDIYIEGLVHITALKNDYYQFDASAHRLTGERTKTIYRLADKVKVKVVRVDLDDKKIDLELA
jgi:ribonuclease R|tara:strand:- start:156 stop:482 length:327 start_codon:yes stop_codon:yes gene_type:complete